MLNKSIDTVAGMLKISKWWHWTRNDNIFYQVCTFLFKINPSPHSFPYPSFNSYPYPGPCSLWNWNAMIDHCVNILCRTLRKGFPYYNRNLYHPSGISSWKPKIPIIPIWVSMCLIRFSNSLSFWLKLIV